MKKNVLYIFVLVFLVFIFSGCSSTEELNLKEYVNFELTGYEGHGRLDLIMKDSIYDGINKILGYKTEDLQKEDVISRINYATEAMKTIHIRLNKSEKLSNGDKVTASVIYDEELMDKAKLKLSTNKIEYEVKGLKEVKVIDPFKDLTLDYFGFSPELTLNIKNDKIPEECRSLILYRIEGEDEKRKKVKNGDSIVVVAEYNKDIINDKGYIINKNKKTYKVEGEPEFIRSITKKDIDAIKGKLLECAIDKAEDIKRQKRWDALDGYYSFDTNEWEEKYTISPIKAYFMYPKESTVGNQVVVIYEANVETKLLKRTNISYEPKAIRNVQVGEVVKFKNYIIVTQKNIYHKKNKIYSDEPDADFSYASKLSEAIKKATALTYNFKVVDQDHKMFNK